MLEDRLRPRYSGRSATRAGCTLYKTTCSGSESRPELKSNQRSPQQRKARAIVNKYKKTVRYAQLHRLKSLLPALKHQEQAEEVDVLQETVRYIEDLERRLLAQVQCAGLPHQLKSFQNKHDAAVSNPETGENPGEAPVEIHDLRSLLHARLQPALRHKLDKQREHDNTNIQQLLRDSGAAGPS